MDGIKRKTNISAGIVKGFQRFKTIIIAPRITVVTKQPERVVSWRPIYHKIALDQRKQVPHRSYAVLLRRTAKVGKRYCDTIIYHTPLIPPEPPSRKEIVDRVVISVKQWFLRRRLTVAAVSLIGVSFFAGMVAVTNEQRSLADTLPAPVVSEIAPEEAIDLNTFANTVVSSLSGYNEVPSGPDTQSLRIAQLKKYLAERKSPFADDDEAIRTLLSLPHMRLVLAISYAESTMGKNCYFNNCSGIGGSVPNLRKYKEFRNWMIDLNDLLERRYKDWTLQQMCGVYVQPCNPNWLKATHQILQELDEAEIQ